MSDVKWIKITTDMFDNRKIKHLRRLPDGNNIVLIWVMLLTMAGRCNSGGMIFLTENIPYTPKMLADELDFEESTVRLALDALEQLNMIRTDGFLSISGWEKYQNIEGMDKIREQTRQRVARFRERQKDNLLEGKKICAYCGNDGDTIDHVIPKSKGGLDIPENVVPCCLACNMEKTNRDVATFLNERLLLGKPVDIKGIESNKVLKRYIFFDYLQNRFVTQVTENVTLPNATDIDIDKEIDIDIDIEKEKDNRKNRKRFIPPSVDEVRAYCKERKNNIDAEHFIDYYQVRGWELSKGRKMKDWRAAIRTWERNGFSKKRVGANGVRITDDRDDILDGIL